MEKKRGYEQSSFSHRWCWQATVPFYFSHRRKTMSKYVARVRKFFTDKDEVGATMVEYGLMIALISAVVVTLVVTLGTKIKAAFQTLLDNL
jgi:pilus assembly protein Flp/PilA